MNEKINQIIIGGLQRSGTSILRAILGSHSEISFYQWDLELWTKFSNIYYDKSLTIAEKNKLINDVLNHPKQKAANVRFHPNDFSFLIDSLKKASNRSFFIEFYYEFLNRYLKRTKGSIVGLKTPENEFYVDRIFKEFPDTKFIHIIRNPLDVAVSLKKAKDKWWGGSMNYYSHIRKWKISTEIASKYSRLYPEKYFVLKYEDLIFEPYDTIKNICNFLNIDFQKEMLLMKNHPGWKGDNSSFKNNSDEILFQTGSINQYKKQLPTKIKNTYYFFLKDNLANNNYYFKELNLHPNQIITYKINYTLQSIKEFIIKFIMGSKLYVPIKKSQIIKKK